MSLSDDEWAIPTACGAPADRDSHSIQENGPLWEIATPDKGGKLVVLQLYPDFRTVTDLTKGDNRIPGHRALWDIHEVKPHCVSIAQASIRHFACSGHDSDPDILGRADNLEIPDLRGRNTFDDHDVPPDLVRFLDSLFFLSYRTLLFRISQFRGAEGAVLNLLQVQHEAENRFAVSMSKLALGELSETLMKLHRLKTAFDRRILGDSPAIHLVHHVRTFSPHVRYASSEYVPVEFSSGRRRPTIWMSVNVLPIGGKTWLFVSHPCERRPVIIDVGKKVDAIASSHRRQRRRVDLEMMGECSNLYASPEDFINLPERDQSFVRSSMAKSAFDDHLTKGLELLRSSPVGGELISHVERRLRAEDRAKRHG